MEVTLKRDWFSPSGELHKAGKIEYDGEVKYLPSDAVYAGKEGDLFTKTDEKKK